MALLVLAGLLAAVFGSRKEALTVTPRRPEDRDVLRVAYTWDMRPDPHRRSSPLPQYNHFILSLWEPLVECDSATGVPEPAAARSWEWSADRKTLTLQLRPDARWSNGDPVTAQDFVRGWDRLLHQNVMLAQTLFPLKNAEAYQAGNVTDLRNVGMRALDDLTLRLELDQPRSSLVAELADPLLAPLHPSSLKVLDSAVYLTDPAALVSNGAFCLVQAGPDGFRLEANAYYHSRGEVRLAGLQFIRAGSRSMAPLLVAAGVADLFTPMPYGQTRALPTDRPVNLDSELVLGITALDFNVTHGPLHDVRVRQALALALDRVGPIQKFDPGHMVPAWSWVPSMPGRAGLVLLKEDVAEARRLLAAAGYPGGKGFPVLRLTLPLWMESDPFPSAYCERWFQQLGITIYPAYESPAKMNARLRAGDYDLLYGTLAATVPDAGDLLSGFLLPLEYTTTKWIDQDVICLLSEANRLTGSARLASLERAERAIMAAVPSVPLMFERRQVMCGAEVRGWYRDALARQSLKRLWLESPPPSYAYRSGP